MSQVSPHSATRINFPGRYGSLAALRRPVSADSPIALLVPGFTGSKEDFVDILDPLADGGVEPIAIDLPGQYESDGPPEHDSYLPSPLGALVAELVEKLAADGRRVFLLGHSYGGLVARGATLADAPIHGLTLLSTGPQELPDGPRRQALDMAEAVLRDHGLEALANLRDLLDQQNPVWQRHPDELKEFFRVRFRRTSLDSLIGMAVGLRGEPDLVNPLARKLAATAIPCLVACGADDDAWPVATQRDMAERLDADFAVIPVARHHPPTENPTALAALLLATWRTWLSR
ncbi:alpha/beta fold hydrolase [Actinocrispum wychmicini]|uniref:Pimeloyl-ACP methyl ester carboxylesterase n=1 Tax=Actinocrispum wychmicini TaxID=1213861 RepID=A0A4R2JWW2_9PSEU|nr:alpha/beta hydrolase [Actinocrispum wychmicini]TCO58645.1 pimeloyl-ACP methyl ester carboxylesterase [Actinocrispum wychmicini]